jgi:fructosamine-3-kinase
MQIPSPMQYAEVVVKKEKYAAGVLLELAKLSVVEAQVLGRLFRRLEALSTPSPLFLDTLCTRRRRQESPTAAWRRFYAKQRVLLALLLAGALVALGS